jgi:hypothetical protein
MTWAKLDDAILDNPKIIRVGPIGFALHVAAITWSARNLTDGFIPEAKSKQLLAPNWCQASENDERDTIWELSATTGMHGFSGQEVIELIIKGLVEAGLWHEDFDERGNAGYRLHDYLEYNPSQKEVLNTREIKRKSGIAGGKQSAKQRASKQSSRIQAEGQAEGQAKSKQEGKRNPTPVPVPVPVKDQDQIHKDQNIILASLPADTERIDQVYAHHRQYHPRCLQSIKSASKEYRNIKARLGDGFTVDSLCKAIDGFNADKWVNDTGQTVKLEYLMREKTSVEQYLERAINGPPRSAPVGDHAKSIEAALRGVEDYNARVTEIESSRMVFESDGRPVRSLPGVQDARGDNTGLVASSPRSPGG